MRISVARSASGVPWPARMRHKFETKEHGQKSGGETDNGLEDEFAVWTGFWRGTPAGWEAGSGGAIFVRAAWALKVPGAD